MTLAECPHGLDDPAWCSTCQRGPSRPPKVNGRPFVARFSGQCKRCGAIEEGDLIVPMSDGTYRHEECV